MPEEDLRALLGTCLAVPRWIEEVAAARPYADVEALIGRADEAASGLTEDELETALARHPRIGERPVDEAADSAFSRHEQAGVDAGNAGVARQLRDGNAAYEQRFGRVFLIRAKGRSSQEILGELRRRLSNEPQTEAREVAGQLREIALLRIREVLAG